MAPSVRRHGRESSPEHESTDQLTQNMNNNKYYWDEVYNQQKDEIKTNILGCLVSPHQ